MIQVNELTFSYPKSKHNVFEELSLQLKENRIYGLLGRNGMGKSTLLYLIAGLLRPQKGSVLVDGYTASSRYPEMLEELYIVPEEYDLPNMPLSKYAKIHEDFYPRFSEEVLEKCLSDFEMSSDLDFKQLSMGQKKKVYMSFCTCYWLRLLLMDEPTNGLDIPSKALFRKVVAGNMAEDSSLIISTHQVHDIEQLLDHILIMNNSELLLNASSEEVTNNTPSHSVRQVRWMIKCCMLNHHFKAMLSLPSVRKVTMRLLSILNYCSMQLFSVN